MTFEILIALIIFLYPLVAKYFGKKSYCVLVTIALCFLAGFRGLTVGTDTQSYNRAFLLADSFSFNTIKVCFENKEPLYFMLQSFFSTFTHSFTLFLVVVAVFYNTCVTRMIYRHSSNIVLSYLMFLSMGYFFFSMAGIRQTIAMGFLILAMEYLIDNYYMKCVLCVILATGFHITSLLFFVIFLLWFIPLNGVYMGFVGLFSALVYKFGSQVSPILVELVWQDERKYKAQFGGFSTLVLLVIISLATLFIYRKLTRKVRKKDIGTSKEALMLNEYEYRYTKKNQLFLKMTMFSIPLQVLVIYQANAFRLSMMFHVVTIVLVPNVISQLANKRSRIIGNMLLIAMVLLQFFLYTYYTADIIPYQFYWQ